MEGNSQGPACVSGNLPGLGSAGGRSPSLKMVSASLPPPLVLHPEQQLLAHPFTKAWVKRKEKHGLHRESVDGCLVPAPARAIPTGDAERTLEGYSAPIQRHFGDSAPLNFEQSSQQEEDKMAPNRRSGEKQKDKSCFKLKG